MQDNNKLEFYKKKVLVVGLGISGLYTARLLSAHGAEVTVSEILPESDLDPEMLNEMGDLGITLETGGHKEETFLNAEMVIISPGVPHDTVLLNALRKRNIPVIGELEAAGRLIDTPMIAVTGTNGKSTVTAFFGCMLENAGFRVFVGGNIGTPLAAYAAGDKKADYAVVEVSSFQLDTIETFCPFVSVVLNISPDHLDRYPGYEAYAQSKLKIFGNQGPGQYVILNDDDETLCAVNLYSGVTVLRYGTEKKQGRHAYIEDEKIQAFMDGAEPNTFSFKSFSLPGTHNLENLLPAVLGGLALGIDTPVIQKTIDEFKGLPNRLEQVAEHDGVAFYNDSKATNVDAAVRAVMSFKRSIILIAGGRHKGADYVALAKAAKGKVRKAVFLGEAKDLLAESFEGIVPFSMAENMEEAVAMSFESAENGDAVLLSPACSSFDMFTDYSHRGREFKTAVLRVIHG
ncbi:MAG: UDP-N-acetylmuramoyl-L-alanine--D-glutamate ligase [Deltaproteobacteria bacterium]|nr:UDP-N-acetylmuramoyl-L-alanine--D-glutamate ligase [Deltaproteobacteria bacterium]